MRHSGAIRKCACRSALSCGLASLSLMRPAAPVITCSYTNNNQIQLVPSQHTTKAPCCSAQLRFCCFENSHHPPAAYSTLRSAVANRFRTYQHIDQSSTTRTRHSFLALPSKSHTSLTSQPTYRDTNNTTGNLSSHSTTSDSLLAGKLFR